MFWVAFVHRGRHRGQQFNDDWSIQDRRHTGQKKTLQVVKSNISFKFNDYGDYGLLGSRPVVRMSVYGAILELVAITAHLSLRPKVS